jgi:hypothetical protein
MHQTTHEEACNVPFAQLLKGYKGPQTVASKTKSEGVLRDAILWYTLYVGACASGKIEDLNYTIPLIMFHLSKDVEDHMDSSFYNLLASQFIIMTKSREEARILYEGQRKRLLDLSASFFTDITLEMIRTGVFLIEKAFVSGGNTYTERDLKDACAFIVKFCPIVIKILKHGGLQVGEIIGEPGNGGYNKATFVGFVSELNEQKQSGRADSVLLFRQDLNNEPSFLFQRAIEYIKNSLFRNVGNVIDTLPSFVFACELISIMKHVYEFNKKPAWNLQFSGIKIEMEVWNRMFGVIPNREDMAKLITARMHLDGLINLN